MRETILLVATIVMSITAKAWEVGDFYTEDPTGVPAIVAYVDESGEHGLIMAPRQFSQEGFDQVSKDLNVKLKSIYQQLVMDLESSDSKKQKNAKMQVKLLKLNVDSLKAVIEEQGDLYGKTYRETMEWLEKQELPKNAKRKGFKEKLLNQYIDDLAEGNTEYGESNTQAIIKYCNENSVDMQLYFPIVQYAVTLGEGWFVPGNHELELIATYYTDSIGEKNKQKTIDFQNKERELTKRKGSGSSLYPFFNNLQSSTFTKSNWSKSDENKEKIGKILSTGGKDAGPLTQLIVLSISAAEQAPYYALTEMHQGLTAKSWFIFARNNYEAYPAAVKRF